MVYSAVITAHPLRQIECSNCTPFEYYQKICSGLCYYVRQAIRVNSDNGQLTWPVFINRLMAIEEKEIADFLTAVNDVLVKIDETTFIVRPNDPYSWHRLSFVDIIRLANFAKVYRVRDAHELSMDELRLLVGITLGPSCGCPAGRACFDSNDCKRKGSCAMICYEPSR